MKEERIFFGFFFLSSSDCEDSCCVFIVDGRNLGITIAVWIRCCYWTENINCIVCIRRPFRKRYLQSYIKRVYTQDNIVLPVWRHQRCRWIALLADETIWWFICFSIVYGQSSRCGETWFFLLLFFVNNILTSEIGYLILF